MSDIVLKKENHASRLDQEQERELLKEDFDVLVLEGQEEPETDWNNYGPFSKWFGLATDLYFWITEPVYQNDGSLREIAKYKDIDIEYTREGDFELIENAPLHLRLFALLTFYGFFLGSMYLGIYKGGYWNGILVASIWLMGAITVPIMVLRIYHSRFSESSNRDRKMAEIIESAAEEGRTLAVVGKSHKVEDYFESDNYEVKNAKSTERTVKSALDYFSRIMKSYFILLSLFLITREIMSFLVTSL